MSDAVAIVIVGALSLLGTLVGTYAGIRKSSALTVYRLEQLEKTVERTNDVQNGKNDAVVSRVVCLEKRSDLFDEKFKVANHRLDDLEKSKT